ncbi:C40 family peptidase [Alicyclobacillus cycloheptanicus]|nr:C40 family peptidase [Alicyclobacillus cycloheptanicus]
MTIVPAYADSLSSEKQQMSQLQAEANQTDKQISQEKAKAAQLTSSIQQTNTSLANIRSAIAANQQQTAAVQAKINVLNTKLQQNQVKLNADKAALEAQIRTMYENGQVPYMNVLMQSTSFDDLLSRLYMLEQISKAQQQLVQQVTDLQQSIEQQQAEQKVQYADLQQKQAQLQTYERAQQILEQQQQSALAEVKSNLQQQTRQRTILESQIQLTQSQIQQIEEETAQAQQIASSHTTGSLAHGNAQQIIQFGEEFMNTPYVWGGTSPSPGFDCSGFVQYVYGHFGIGLPRTSEEQYSVGVPVSESSLEPGDLVFFSTYAPGATHVGIYIGNGMMLDAEDQGVVIDNITNSYWGPKYIGARRVIQ